MTMVSEPILPSPADTAAQPDARSVRRFGVIFVLYHPSRAFLDNLRTAARSGRDIVAVDNSPVADGELHRALRGEGMQVIFNRNRGGLAGAYNRGAEVLLERGCEVIFLLDQDSDIGAAFFEKMMYACAQLRTDTFIVGPRIYEIGLQQCMPVFPPGRRLPRPRRIDTVDTGLFPTLFVISSGSAISAAAYRCLGAFREDYFIEYLDIEYGLRASSRGIPVYVNAAVTLRQTTGHIQRHGKLFTTHHEAWRRYYGARNAVHALRQYRRQWSLHRFSALLALHQAFCVTLFERDRRRKLVAIACGYLDGVRGRLGRFEDRHPRLFALCTQSPRRAGTGP